jgi:DUF309 family protein family protein
VIPTLPLGLRNRLAAVILAALHDARARDDLAVLAGHAGAGAWLEGDDARWMASVAERAAAACRALARCPLLPGEADFGEALQFAAALFDAGLYFEVHEVLEPHWMAASGQTREALQGLIQVAVAWQHVANGNVAGARSLLVEGSRRLHGARGLGVALEPFARAAAEAASRLAAGMPAAPPAFPICSASLTKEDSWTSS